MNNSKKGYFDIKSLYNNLISSNKQSGGSDTSKLYDSQQTTIPEFTLFSLSSMFWNSVSSLLFNALCMFTL